MRRPAYPLEAVRKHREVVKKGAMERLAHRIHIASLEQQRLTDCREKRDAARSFLVETEEQLAVLGTSTSVAACELIRLSEDIDSLRKRVQRRQREVERKLDELAAAEEATRAAREQLAVATREVQVIERHHARWIANWTAEHQREQERVFQDIAITAWTRNGGMEESN